MKSDTPICCFKAELKAEFIRKKLAEGLELYGDDRPNTWRLVSKIANVASKCCKEKGRDGDYKISYPTQRKAIQKANIIHQTRGTILYEYKCDCCDGWHLSKRH